MRLNRFFIILLTFFVESIFSSVCDQKISTINTNDTNPLLFKKILTECQIQSETNVTSVYKIDRKNSINTSSFLYGVLKLASERDEPTKCNCELNQMLQGIHKSEIWALKAMDASAMPTPEFFLGQNFLLGSVKGCKAVQQPNLVTISSRFQRDMHKDLLITIAPFATEYRIVYAEHRSPFQIQVEFTLIKRKILHLGFCLPKSCSNEEIANLTQAYFDESQLDGRDTLEYRANVVGAKDLNVKKILIDDIGLRLLCFGIMLTLLFTVCAARLADEKSDGEPQQHETCEESFIDCFSMQKNLKKLFTLKKSAKVIPAVDGLKSIGCIVVSVFHVCWFGAFSVDNQVTLFAHGEQISWQWLSTAPFVVDMFFTISGFLLAYNFLQNQKRIDEIRSNTLKKNLRLFGKQLLSRYLRLTPLYLVTIIATKVLISYLIETSPFWIHDRFDLSCSKYWWRNLLYIQNVFDLNDLCLTWSWSLACEMQFFILVTALLFFYAKYPSQVKEIFGGILVIVTVLFYIIIKLINFTPAYDVTHSLWNEFYQPPWMRITPYLVGVIGGYINNELKGELKISKKTRRLFWIGAFIVIVATHMCTLFRTLSTATSAPILTLIRLIYPASISWIIIASHTGHGGGIAKFLNSSIFTHLNKLSYAIYLMNPFVVLMIFGLRDHSTHFDNILWTVLTTGIIPIVYALAVVTSLLFEMPYVDLASKLFKSNPNISIISNEVPLANKVLNKVE